MSKKILVLMKFLGSKSFWAPKNLLGSKKVFGFQKSFWVPKKILGSKKDFGSKKVFESKKSKEICVTKKQTKIPNFNLGILKTPGLPNMGGMGGDHTP